MQAHPRAAVTAELWNAPYLFANAAALASICTPYLFANVFTCQRPSNGPASWRAAEKGARFQPTCRMAMSGPPLLADCRRRIYGEGPDVRTPRPPRRPERHAEQATAESGVPGSSVARMSSLAFDDATLHLHTLSGVRRMCCRILVCPEFPGSIAPLIQGAARILQSAVRQTERAGAGNDDEFRTLLTCN